MKQDPMKTVTLRMPRELYDKIKAQATEEFRTVPKEIIQILKIEIGFR